MSNASRDTYGDLNMTRCNETYSPPSTSHPPTAPTSDAHKKAWLCHIWGRRWGIIAYFSMSIKERVACSTSRQTAVWNTAGDTMTNRQPDNAMYAVRPTAPPLINEEQDKESCWQRDVTHQQSSVGASVQGDGLPTYSEVINASRSADYLPAYM